MNTNIVCFSLRGMVMMTMVVIVVVAMGKGRGSALPSHIHIEQSRGEQPFVAAL